MMTREEAAKRIEDHMRVHKNKEPFAIHITEALEMAAKVLRAESPILNSDDCAIHMVQPIYAKILDCSVCLRDIRKISIRMNNGTNGRNEHLHTLFILFKDGRTDEFTTNNREKAEADFREFEKKLLSLREIERVM